jgi:hypothetical protein
MKTTTSLPLVVLAGLLALSPVSAQTTASVVSADTSAGLLGQTYTGGEFAYTHHVESPPRTLRRYGFVSYRPLGELGPQVDAAFRYDYNRSSLAGITNHEHDVTATLLRYWVQDTAKPFVHADLGWAWQKFGGANDHSLLYRVGAGVELALKPRLAATPFVNYRETRNFDQRAWNFGAKIAYRMHQHWNSSFTVQVDDSNNVEYTIGLQRRL